MSNRKYAERLHNHTLRVNAKRVQPPKYRVKVTLHEIEVFLRYTLGGSFPREDDIDFREVAYAAMPLRKATQEACIRIGADAIQCIDFYVGRKRAERMAAEWIGSVAAILEDWAKNYCPVTGQNTNAPVVPPYTPT